MYFTGTELTRDPDDPRRFEIHPSRAFFALGSGSINVVRADPRAPRTCTIDYRAEDFHYLDQPAEVVPNDYLLRVRKAVIVNVVNVAPAVGEEMLGNNKAIEVVQGSPSR